MNKDGWDHVIEKNLEPAFLVTSAGIPLLKKAQKVSSCVTHAGGVPGRPALLLASGAAACVIAVSTAEPDGHTITFLTSPLLVIQPIIRTYDIPAALNVRKCSEWKNFDQRLAWVKAHSGEFIYGTSGGTGSGGHIATEQLADALGVELRHVPFEGSAPLMAALMGGQIIGSNQVPDIHNDGELFR